MYDCEEEGMRCRYELELTNLDTRSLRHVIVSLETRPREVKLTGLKNHNKHMQSHRGIDIDRDIASHYMQRTSATSQISES